MTKPNIDAMRRSIAFALGAAPGLSPLAAPNDRAQSSTKKHDWLPTECAPKAYPMYVVRGVLTLEDGRYASVPSLRTTNKGWGSWGSTHVVGDQLKAIPVAADLQWFSWTEDRFYRATFDLPREVIAKWFRDGLAVPRRGRKSQFDGVVVGMAPLGMATVWLSAYSEKIEVAVSHGNVVDLDWDKLFPGASLSRADFREFILKERLTPEWIQHLRDHGPPPGQFESYRQLYRWAPWVTGGTAPTEMSIRSFNGEDAYIGAKGACIPREQRPVPRMVEIDWTNSLGVRRSADVVFNEDEIFAAFRFMAADRPDAPLVLHFETTPDHVEMWLRDNERRVHLRKTTVKTFQV